MKRWGVPLAVLVVLGLVPAFSLGWARAQQRGLRLGIFDSRAVAVAYARSEIHGKWMQELMDRKKKAEQAGDKERIAAIEAEGSQQQRRFHLQGFSVAPIDDILVHLEKGLPAVAEQAGVDAIVNRWSVVHKGAGLELVDVTEAMIAPFHPNEQTLAIIRDMKDKPPLTLDQAEQAD